MNYSLAKEIYGNPWFMDYLSMQKFAGLLEHIKNGGEIKEQALKNNSSHIFNVKTKATITDKVYEAANDDKGNEYVSVIHIDGPITKNGGASSYGTVDLANQLKKFENLDNVIGHILYSESGGGSANAIKYITDVMQDEVNKPIVSYIEDISASACYYINSYSDYIIANDKNALIGSIGTMIEMAGYPKIAESKEDGFRYVRVYADDAFNKNKEFEEAINNLNFKPIKEKILNPHNDQFKKDVLNNRENVREIELTGEIFNAGEVVGTLIDKIGTFEDAVNKVIELSSDNLINNSSINKNNENMTRQEFKTQHPEAYNEILQEGILSERDRCEAFMEFVEVDAGSVKKQITDGNQITSKFMAEMTMKMAINASKTEVVEDSQEIEDNQTTAEEKTNEQLEAEKFEEEVMAGMNFKKEVK